MSITNIGKNYFSSGFYFLYRLHTLTRQIRVLSTLGKAARQHEPLLPRQIITNLYRLLNAKLI